MSGVVCRDECVYSSVIQLYVLNRNPLPSPEILHPIAGRGLAGVR